MTQTHSEWLADRKTGIGASDAAAAIGVSPWASPLSLWAEKTGAVQPEDLSGIERIQWGHILQAPIVAEFSKRTGRKVRNNRSNAIRRHPKHSWMIATLDADQRMPSTDHLDGFGATGCLEVKNVSAWMASEWEEDAPLHVQVQLQHQIAVTGRTWGSIVALIGGNELRWFDHPRNDGLVENLIAAEQRFWGMVQSGQQPDADGMDCTARTLKRMYGEEDGTTVEMPDTALAWDVDLQEAKAKIKAGKAIESKCSNLIRQAIGDHTYGQCGVVKYSWKASEKTGNRTLRKVRL